MRIVFELQDKCGFRAGDTNLYRYVSNKPTNFTDPSGLVMKVGDETITRDNYENSQIYKQFLNKATAEQKNVVKEMLLAMIESRVENKTYTFATENELLQEINLRLNVIKIARLMESKRVKDRAKENEPGFHMYRTKGVYFEIPEYMGAKPKLWDSFTVVFERPGEKPKEIKKEQAIGMAGKFRFAGSALEEVFAWKGPVYMDCASAVTLAIHGGLFDTIGKDKYTNLFPAKVEGKVVPIAIVQSAYLDFISSRPEKVDALIDLAQKAIRAGNAPTLVSDLIPGDMRTFYNPRGKDTEFENENTIYLGSGQYFAWPLGIMTRDDLITELSGKEKVKDPAAEIPISVRPTIPAR